jgi:type I restriction enzyme M protein
VRAVPSVLTDEINAIEDGKIFDYITGRPVAENDKERVRQRIARALFHEYGISVDDMEPDFKVKVDGSNKKIDIAIFEPGSEHAPENVRRLVVCQKELKLGDRGASVIGSCAIRGFSPASICLWRFS